MKTLHTPGTWEVSDIMLNYPDQSKSYDVKVDSQVIATVYGKNQEEAKANARIIATASDMLDALQIIASWDRNDTETLRMKALARAIIKRATGEKEDEQ
jgi:hypothetical protein